MASISSRFSPAKLTPHRTPVSFGGWMAARPSRCGRAIGSGYAPIKTHRSFTISPPTSEKLATLPPRILKSPRVLPPPLRIGTAASSPRPSVTIRLAVSSTGLGSKRISLLEPAAIAASDLSETPSTIRHVCSAKFKIWNAGVGHPTPTSSPMITAPRISHQLGDLRAPATIIASSRNPISRRFRN